MKKQVTSLLIVFLFLGTFGGFADEPFYDTPSEQTTIDLHGKLDASAGPNDVVAYFDGNDVHVVFYRSFGNVSVILYNPLGVTIYSDIVNTSVQQHLVIPVVSLIDGIYTIVLENATGYVDGEFEKNS